MPAVKTVRIGETAIAAEAFGDPAHPPMMLIMGGMASMLWWPETFCRRLAERGRFVIRYDQRDTGLSTKYPPGEPGYGMDDVVDDAFAVLDAHGISSAHFVGFSLGGMIGQVAALKKPQRVRSLTVISSSPIGGNKTGLPPSGDAWLEHMNEEVNLADRAATVDYMVEDSRLVAGVARPFNAVEMRAFIERDFDRSGGYLSGANHSVLFKIGAAWRDRLHVLNRPLLVIHGTADPVFPQEHGEALAQLVDGARLVKLDGGGHELHPVHWDRIIDAIIEHSDSVTSVPAQHMQEGKRS
ncbi:MAG: alpha/beta hydrolase [Rhodospirillales bacterium]|nr:alpha/beta hydrolase [Rhodospirillales bacterium]